MLLYWVWFAELPNLRPWHRHILLQYFRDPEELYNAPSDSYAAIPGITDRMLQALKNKDLTTARKIIAVCKESHIRILSLQDAAYPQLLKNTPTPPLVLYCKGKLPDLAHTPVIAVIGTRKATSYGMTTSLRLGAHIAACGGIVVSGGAFGNDTTALQGALFLEKPVIAVLACGVDVVYPKSNQALFDKIQEHGCLLSEYPPGTPPYRWNFPARNRILSGISNGVLVVEAPEVSGALITARLALEQGREVFAVPGNIDVPTSVGSNALLQDRASAVFTGWDIMKVYAPFFPDKVHRAEPPTLPEIAPPVQQVVLETVKTPKRSHAKSESGRKTPIDKEEKSSYSVLDTPMPTLSQEEQALLSHLTREARPVDDVIAELGLPSFKVLSLLTTLAVKGMVLHHPGGMISLKNR